MEKLQHVAIIWVQVTQPRFLLLALSGMLALAPSTLSVLGTEGEEVGRTAYGGEADESKGEGVTLGILGSILGQESEGGDDRAAVTEAGHEGGTNAAPQVPTDCRRVCQITAMESVEGIDPDLRLVLTQQTIIALAAY